MIYLSSIKTELAINFLKKNFCTWPKTELALERLTLRDLWDLFDKSVSVGWTPSNEADLSWWSDFRNLLAGVPLEPQHLDLLFWSDASDLGWGASLMDQFISGLWSAEEQGLSISLRELRSFRLGLQHFQHSLWAGPDHLFLGPKAI